MGSGQYILANREVIPAINVRTWGRFFETDQRIVQQHTTSKWFISTVFLGIDHRFAGQGPPIIFETMVFHRDRRGDDQECSRYCTWQEAMRGHYWTLGKYRYRRSISSARPIPFDHILNVRLNRKVSRGSRNKPPEECRFIRNKKTPWQRLSDNYILEGKGFGKRKKRPG